MHMVHVAQHSYLQMVLILASSIILLNHAPGFTQSHNPLNQTITEDDWTLPSWVVKSTNCGLFDVPSVPDASSLLLTWRKLNPADGVYNWHLIDTALSMNVPIFIRIWASDTAHCPLWLKTKHPSIPVLHWGATGEKYNDLIQYQGHLVNDYPAGWASPGNFYALWNPDFEAEFNRFLAAFKAKNFLANPNVKFMYAPGAWRWNEWEVGGMLAEIKSKAPIQSVDFVAWFKRHIDAYVDAANGYANKLVYTGYGHIEFPFNYAGDAGWFHAINDTVRGQNLLCDYAVLKGMGVRQGAQEYFNGSSDIASWGGRTEFHNGANYLVTDESHPLIADSSRIIGTENEGFCDATMLGVCSYYHLKMSTLKALQLRVNWLNTRDNLVAMAPALFDYARKTMGKRPQSSPDAWVALRATYDANFSATPPNPIANPQNWSQRLTNAYRNYEKWLVQREVSPGGLAVPVYQLQSTVQFDVWNFLAYEAMRTDHASGNDYMYFGVHDAFMYGGVNNVQIKVTYLDNFAGSWRIDYDAANGLATKASNVVTNTNSNTWKTVTVAIPDAGFTNRQSGGMDFRIYNGGASDLTVRFVRVVRVDKPSGTVRFVQRSGPANPGGIAMRNRAGSISITTACPASVGLYDLTGRKLVHDFPAGTSHVLPLHKDGIRVLSIRTTQQSAYYTVVGLRKTTR